jgi:hypothetical protein
VKGKTENSFTAIPHGNIGATRTCVIKTQAGKGAVKGSFLFFTWKLVESTIKKKLSNKPPT